MFAIVIATTAFLVQHDSVINAEMAVGDLQQDELRYLTEAGLKHAEWIANQGACSAYDLPATSFGSGSYRATFTPTSGSPVSITATGTAASGASRTVSRTGFSAYTLPLTVVIQPDAAEGVDTWLYDWKATWNYGVQSNIKVIKDAWERSHGLIRFDLSSIPKEARIQSAVLELHQQSPAADGGDVLVHRMTTSWSEGTTNQGTGEPNWTQKDGTTNWATPGGDFDAQAIATASVPDSTVGWSQWDITALVQGWVAGSYSNDGMALLPSETEKIWVEFSSSDNADPALHPRLLISYACECGVGNGSGMLQFQPDGITGKDTAIYSTQPANNNGSFPAMPISEAGDTQRGLLGFDTSSIPAGVFVDSAELQLEVTNVTDPGVFAIHQVIAPWEEMEATWTDAATGVTWSSAGADFDPTIIASATVTGVQKYAFDVTGAVRNWLHDGDPNHGFLLEASFGADASFASSENPDSGKRPQITVHYTCPCGPCPTGGGSGPGGKDLLFVVASDASLTTEETAHRTLIESWGFTVQIIDDDATQSEFDTAVAASNVVFTTNDITASRLNTKLVNAPIGVVTSEDNLSDEFGLSSSIGWESGDVVEINDNVHYITNPFPVGLLTIFSSSDSLAYLTGTLSADLSKLASSSSGFGVVALEAGASMVGGGNTAGRRVQLPWGGGGFSLANLNADGRTILQRALEWGNGAVSAGKNIVMVVGDPLNLTPEQADKQALMEGWGHQVDFIAASATQSAFDDAAANSDLVYVPELGTSAMNDLGSKADDLAVGVITEESRRAIKMGSFLLDPFVDGTSINITDNGHYITDSLPTGNLVLSTSTQSMWRIGGTLAPDLQILGELSGAVPGLAVVESGDLVNDGQPAPGRRVKLPWGAYNFDVNLLTPEALTIMQRAIEWGAAVPPVGGGGGGGGNTANFGYETVFDSAQSGVRRKQIATQVVLPENGTIFSITAYVGGRARPIRFALYSDNAGEPDQLLVESQTNTSGNAMAWLSLDVPETYLTAGVYWLALSFDDSAQQYVFTTGGQARYRNHRATVNGFTSPFGAEQSLPRNISIYGTYTPE